MAPDNRPTQRQTPGMRPGSCQQAPLPQVGRSPRRVEGVVDTQPHRGVDGELVEVHRGDPADLLHLPADRAHVLLGFPSQSLTGGV